MKLWNGYRKGINFGGYLSQCDYTKEHYERFITKEDVMLVKEKGYDHIRLPIDYEVIMDEDGLEKSDGFFFVSQMVNWCEEAGLHIILDLHKTKGYSFNEPESAYSFFSDDSLQSYFIHLWEVMALKYGGEEMVAFELLNEIVPYDVADQWNEIAQKAVKAIRKIAKETPIIIGGVCYNSVAGLLLLRKPKENGVIYTFHCYEPFVFTHQRASWVDILPKDIVIHYPEEFEKSKQYLAESIQEKLEKEGISHFGKEFFYCLLHEVVKKAEEDDVLLYCGEYGVIEHADSNSTKNFLSDIETVFLEYGIGHAVWTYKSLHFGMKERNLL